MLYAASVWYMLLVWGQMRFYSWQKKVLNCIQHQAGKLITGAF
jgi:hypothetical protein